MGGITRNSTGFITGGVMTGNGAALDGSGVDELMGIGEQAGAVDVDGLPVELPGEVFHQRPPEWPFSADTAVKFASLLSPQVLRKGLLLFRPIPAVVGEAAMRGMWQYRDPSYARYYNICDEDAFLDNELHVRYPRQMPRQWLDNNTVSERTFVVARQNGWSVVDLYDVRFIVPPEEILKQIESLPILVNQLEDMCPETAPLGDDSGRTVYHPQEFLKYVAGEESISESILRSLQDGWSLVEVDGEVYVIPPEIGKEAAVYLAHVNELGLIGLRGGARAPWRPYSQRREGHFTAHIALKREGSGGELDIEAFVLRQWERWGGKSGVKGVVNLADHPWLEAYPELREWLRANMSYVEPLDMIRLQQYTASVEGGIGLNGAIKPIKGVIGEIAIRGDIVAHYREIIKEHPRAILAVAPQIWSGDIHEASDAVIGVVSDNGDEIELISVWEVTTDAKNIVASKRQMDKTLNDRFPLGIHLRDENGDGKTLKMTIAEGGLEDAVRPSSDIPEDVLRATELRLATRFSNSLSSVSEAEKKREWTISGHRQRGEYDALLASLSAGPDEWGILRFETALAGIHPNIRAVFVNLTRPADGTRKSVSVLGDETGWGVSHILKWKDRLEAVCLQRGWQMAKPPRHFQIVHEWQGRWEKLYDVMEEAVSGEWDFDRVILAFRDVHPHFATVFSDMIRPAGGVRMTSVALAALVGLTNTGVQNWLQKFDDFAARLKLSPAALPETSRRGGIANARWTAFDELVERARSEKMGMDAFLEELGRIDPDFKTVFENMARPSEGKRSSPEKLAIRTSVNSNAISDWEETFTVVFEEFGWSYAEIAGYEREMVRAESREKFGYLDELAAQAESGRWTTGQFLYRLMEDGRHDIAMVLANLVEPEDGVRVSRQALAVSLGLKGGNKIFHLEHRLIEICRRLGYDIAKGDVQLEHQQDGIKRFDIIDDLEERAAKEEWGVDRFIDELEKADPKMAVVFINMVRPEGEGRKNPDELVISDELDGLGKVPVKNLEKRFAKLCSRFGWIIAERRGRSKGVAEMHGRVKKMKTLMEKARSEKWDIDRFESELNKADPWLAVIFKNITRPEGGVRETAPRLVTQTSGDQRTSGHVRHWEDFFEQVCSEFHWPVVARQEMVVALGIGQRRRYFFKGLVDKANSERWTKEQLLEAVREKDPDLARMLLAESGQDALAKELGVVREVVRRWRNRYKDLNLAPSPSP